jgi:hypothetical protein
MDVAERRDAGPELHRVVRCRCRRHVLTAFDVLESRMETLRGESWRLGFRSGKHEQSQRRLGRSSRMIEDDKKGTHMAQLA